MASYAAATHSVKALKARCNEPRQFSKTVNVFTQLHVQQTNLGAGSVDGMGSTQLALTVGQRYRGVLARAVVQGDVEQADPASAARDSLTVVVRTADVQETSQSFVHVERGRQLVLVAAQRVHHLAVSTSERLGHRYQHHRQVLLVPSHPRVTAR